MAQFQLQSEHIPEDLYWLYELVGMERFMTISQNSRGDLSTIFI